VVILSIFTENIRLAMPTCQKQLVCSVCTFANLDNVSKCKICGSSLKSSFKINSSDISSQLEISKLIDKKQKERKATVAKQSNTSVIGTIFLTAALTISSIGMSKVVFNYVVNTTLVAQQKVPNESGDIQLYDTIKAVPNVPGGTFSYGGAICFAALQRDGMNAAIAKAHSQFRLRYVEPKTGNPGCTTGIEMLLEGELSIAQNSRPLLKAELAAAKERGFELESVPVAIDGVVFYINKSLGIKSLSLTELRDIYQGKITNWQEVGGKNQPIVPISLDPQIDSLLRLLMKTETAPPIAEDVVIVRDYTTAIRKTSVTPGAISYASAAILRGQQSIRSISLAPDEDSPAVSALLADGSVNLQAFRKNYYPLTRRLFVVFRRDGTPEERAAIAYINSLLSQEGQKIVKEAGMVPIYYW
jgi:phosphate transport system substrate-binding protein